MTKRMLTAGVVRRDELWNCRRLRQQADMGIGVRYGVQVTEAAETVARTGRTRLFEMAADVFARGIGRLQQDPLDGVVPVDTPDLSRPSFFADGFGWLQRPAPSVAVREPFTWNGRELVAGERLPWDDPDHDAAADFNSSYSAEMYRQMAAADPLLHEFCCGPYAERLSAGASTDMSWLDAMTVTFERGDDDPPA